MDKRTEIIGEITAIKSLLVDTDYKSNMLIESLVVTMKDATALNFIAKFIAWLAEAVTEFGTVVEERAAYRTRIRELEAELEALEDETETTE